MEDEIKVNEYVRTKRGIIDKVDALYGMIENTVHLENQKWFNTNNIVKHSTNLIDLIKAEDTIKIKIGLYTSFVHFIVDEDDLISIRTQIEANFWIIDKIYTKEMMESISYKVKE